MADRARRGGGAHFMHTHRRPLAFDVVLGALAGAAGTVLMDQVTKLAYERQPKRVRDREDDARGEKTAFVAAAEKLGAPEAQQEAIGNAIHWALGVGAGAFYGVLRKRARRLRPGSRLRGGVLAGDGRDRDRAARPRAAAAAIPLADARARPRRPRRSRRHDRGGVRYGRSHAAERRRPRRLIRRRPAAREARRLAASRRDGGAPNYHQICAKRTIADLRLTKVQPRESDRFEDDIIYQDGEFVQVPRAADPRD